MQGELFSRDVTPATVLDALGSRIGEHNGITARDLVCEITHCTDPTKFAAKERQLRQAVEQLRLQGHRVCSHPESGYFLAESATELNRACGFLVDRAMTSLRQVCAMKRVALPDLRGQLGLELPSQEQSHDTEQRSDP
jgi:hypothetical protein